MTDLELAASLRRMAADCEPLGMVTHEQTLIAAADTIERQDRELEKLRDEQRAAIAFEEGRRIDAEWGGL